MSARVREVGVWSVYLPAYWSEWNPVARVSCGVRRCVADVVCGSLEAKMAVMEGALHGASDDLVHFVSRDWIPEALAGLPYD